MDLRIVIKWCKPAACWVADVTTASGVPVLSGVSLVTGADLLEQFGYMRFGGQLIVQTDFDVDAVPTFDNLGREGHFYFLSP